MVACRHRFPNADGEQLCAALELPRGAPARGTALFAHCFTCNKDYKAPVWIGRELAAHGIALLRFDFSGLGASEGRFADTTLTKYVADVVSAAHWLATELAAPTLLVGHSLGGAAVIRAAAELPSVKLVATIGSPADPAQASPALAQARVDALRDGAAPLPRGGQSVLLPRTFFDDLDTDPLLDHVRRLRVPLLVMHSPTDAVVSIDQGERLFIAAPQPKAFVPLLGADHLLDRREDARFAAAVLAAWWDRHVAPTTR
jgi:putative redox protein